jgi:hypothetical protein
MSTHPSLLCAPLGHVVGGGRCRSPSVGASGISIRAGGCEPSPESRDPLLEERVRPGEKRDSRADDRVSRAQSRNSLLEERVRPAEKRDSPTDDRVPLAESRDSPPEKRVRLAEKRDCQAEERVPLAESRGPLSRKGALSGARCTPPAPGGSPAGAALRSRARAVRCALAAREPRRTAP